MCVVNLRPKSDRQGIGAAAERRLHSWPPQRGSAAVLWNRPSGCDGLASFREDPILRGKYWPGRELGSLLGVLQIGKKTGKSFNDLRPAQLARPIGPGTEHFLDQEREQSLLSKAQNAMEIDVDTRAETRSIGGTGVDGGWDM